MKPRVQLLLLLLLSLAGGASAQTSAKVDGLRVRGSITDAEGVQFVARDVLAFRDRFLQMLVISDRPFDLSEFWADGRIDHADLVRHHASGAQLLRVGLAGFRNFPTVLTWWRKAGQTPILVESRLLDPALRLDTSLRERLRGALDLHVPASGSGGAHLSVAFDVLDAGANLAGDRWLAPDGGAPFATLRALRAPPAERSDEALIELLHPDWRRRFAEANGIAETDLPRIADDLRRWLPDLVGEDLRGVVLRDQAYLDLRDAQGRHWTAQLHALAPESGWQLLDLRRVPPLPEHDRLPSRVDEIAQARGE